MSSAMNAAIAMNMTYSDKWNAYSVDLIGSMQKDLHRHEWWFVQTSAFGDNGRAFTFFFPIIAGLLNLIGAKALWASIVVEWLNLILKWLFMGDRPFWWTQTTSIYTGQSRPRLSQFFNTCESGPGTPSGHLMMNVALFYVISQGLRQSVTSNTKRFGLFKKLVSLAIMFSNVVWVVMVFMSRLYIQAHFLHQCILGVFIGYLVGKMAFNSNCLVELTTVKALFVTVFIGGSAYGMYATLLHYGMNPLWAIPLAKKYCANPKFVHIQTQPFFLMVRLTASMLGLGLALAAQQKSKFSPIKGVFNSILAVTLGSAIGYGVNTAQAMLPSDQLQLFLGGSFVLYTLLPYLVLVVVPKIVRKVRY